MAKQRTVMATMQRKKLKVPSDPGVLVESAVQRMSLSYHVFLNCLDTSNAELAFRVVEVASLS
jgi:hypothetical protein